MQKMGDDPPFLMVGTEVSAKYKGAFCEAKIRKVIKNIKCKVLFKGSNQTLILSDEHVRGTLRVGAQVEARHPEKNQFLESVVSKIQDCSQYTVVFDDGDITTLRRSALCLKSGRHFAESETLDQLPLTHPEHFGTPVVGGRRGRRSLQTQEDSSEEDEDTAESSRQDRLVIIGSGEREPDIGKVVIVEVSDKKKCKEPWFPGLVVAPTAQDAVTIRVKDEYLVRSFRDGRYYTVPKKEASDFTREASAKTDNTALKAAVEKALQYMDRGELPPHWDRDVLFGLDDASSVDDSKADSEAVSSDEETREAKDHFVARLYKFMDDRGTPINKGPTIMNRDLDLYRLYKVVTQLGGFNRVNNQNAWKIVAQKMLLSGSTAVNLIKQAYKKYLHSFEDFYRKLGCTMHSPSQPTRPRGNRSLLREKDKTASGSSTPKRETDVDTEDKPEKPEIPPPVAPLEEDGRRVKNSLRLKKPDEAEDGAKRNGEDEPLEGRGRKRSKAKDEGEGELTKIRIKEEGPSSNLGPKDDGERKVKSSTPKEQRGTTAAAAAATAAKVKRTEGDAKSGEEGQRSVKREEVPQVKKRGRKPKALTESEEADGCRLPIYVDIQVGDKLRVYYGPNHEMKVTYEAKVNEIRLEGSQKLFLVHYTGWNTRYDEWVKRSRVAENLSWTPGRRRSHGSSPALGKTTPSRPGPLPGKRGKPRTHQDTSRSTTPSSVASSSSIGPRNAQATPSTHENEAGGGTGDGRRRSRRISEMSGVTDADSENLSDREESTPPPPEEEVITPAKRKRGRKKKSESSSAAGDSEAPSTENLEVRSSGRRGRRKRREEDLAPPADMPPEEVKEKTAAEDANASGSEAEQVKGEEHKGKDFDLKKIRSELKMPSDMTSAASSNPPSSPPPPPPAEESSEPITAAESSTPPANQSDDVYEFREPEPFEFEIRDRARKSIRESEDVPVDPPRERESAPADPEPQEEPQVDPVPDPEPQPARPPVIVPAFIPQVMPALSTLARSMVPSQVKGQVVEVMEKVTVKEEILPATVVETQKSPPREVPPEEPAAEVEQVELKVKEEEEMEREVETVVETVVEEAQLEVEPEEEEEEEEEEAKDVEEQAPEETEDANRRNSIDCTTPKVKPEEEFEMSSLLCEETIPGSPVTHSAFAMDLTETGPHPSTSRGNPATSAPESAEEIPFASAPVATSALRGMRDPRPARKRNLREALALQQQQQQQSGGGIVLDNTPPTTPEESNSPASNSPEGGMSPDHDSSNGSSVVGGCKKPEADSGSEKPVESARNLMGGGPRSSSAALLSGAAAATLALKRKEEDGREEESPLRRKRRIPDGSVTTKKGRAYGRSPRRTGSDSEDLVENAALSLNALQYSHPTRPSRYNFCMELDPELDATQRIAVLQEKMRQLRETYMALKTQVATLDRRKKKLRRKDKEEKSSREVTAS